eukprot:4165603-Prymnesium_polylepis.1
MAAEVCARTRTVKRHKRPQRQIHSVPQPQSLSLSLSRPAPRRARDGRRGTGGRAARGQSESAEYRDQRDVVQP